MEKPYSEPDSFAVFLHENNNAIYHLTGFEAGNTPDHRFLVGFSGVSCEGWWPCVNETLFSSLTEQRPLKTGECLWNKYVPKYNLKEAKKTSTIN